MNQCEQENMEKGGDGTWSTMDDSDKQSLKFFS